MISVKPLEVSKYVAVKCHNVVSIAGRSGGDGLPKFNITYQIKIINPGFNCIVMRSDKREEAFGFSPQKRYQTGQQCRASTIS